MRGKFGKELRFKEMGLFSIDLNGEYSADRRYLTVERLDMRWGLVSLSHGRVAEAESEKPGAPRQPVGAHCRPATLPLPARERRGAVLQRLPLRPAELFQGRVGSVSLAREGIGLLHEPAGAGSHPKGGEKQSHLFLLTQLQNNHSLQIVIPASFQSQQFCYLYPM